MTEDTNVVVQEKWYTRPVFFVTDVEVSLRHYCDLLGFAQAWDYHENGRTIVAQVNRGLECELILAEDAGRAGKSRVFISLEVGELATLQQELESRKIPFEQTFWGYPVIRIEDPDGNEMLFPLDEGE
ncbi:MAG: glyoxalase superfamily protein [Chloroflexota bacterium]